MFLMKANLKSVRYAVSLWQIAGKRIRDFAVSVQNLSEFYVVVTKKISNPIPTKVAKDFIEHIIDFQGWHVITYNAQTIKSAIGIRIITGMHYWRRL
jgi:predicted nucleic acid-binding protein